VGVVELQLGNCIPVGVYDIIAKLLLLIQNSGYYIHSVTFFWFLTWFLLRRRIVACSVVTSHCHNIATQVQIKAK
ncbi:MAG: hypothetical protein SNH27_13515, partial [Rikenellaceae bacterium]